jgi:hypothetical protein
MNKLLLTLAALPLALVACGGWSVQPLPLPQYTPPPSQTPSIYTPTPVVLPPPVTATGSIFPTNTPLGNHLPATATRTPTVTPEPKASDTASPTATRPPAFDMAILSCNTSLDLTHGMGEVTNAYVQVRNTGGTQLTEVCATLRGLDEDRAHPDKTKCTGSLPIGYQITYKLTVDTGYKQDTPIQVDVSTGQGLALRAGKESCTDIGLPGIDPPGLDTIQPIQ